MPLPFLAPIEPMLAKLSETIPEGPGWCFEPKWDGFRTLLFSLDGKVHIQSRDLKPMNRYFPELDEALPKILPPRCVLDGEIVIARDGWLDFEALLQRIHPAASRAKMLSEQTPASYVAWDLLAFEDEDLRQVPYAERRARLEREIKPQHPVFITPMTRDHAIAADWFSRFEGAGLDGVMAKREEGVYEPGKRTMMKIKHARTADCVVAGFRWHKDGKDVRIGSLLLGLYDKTGELQHVGVTAGFTKQKREEMVAELAPLREGALENHPWRAWRFEQNDQRMPGATSRWNRNKDLGWEPLRIERVAEVGYDHLQGRRFRHGTHMKRWRPDKRPEDCTYEQLDVAAPFEIEKIFSAKT